MAKPAYSAITFHPKRPVIVFVPSRNHCRSVAMNLITECVLSGLNNIRGFVPSHVDQNELEFRLVKLQDRTLVNFILKGIGSYHVGHYCFRPRYRRLIHQCGEHFLKQSGCWVTLAVARPHRCRLVMGPIQLVR